MGRCSFAKTAIGEAFGGAPLRRVTTDEKTVRGVIAAVRKKGRGLTPA